VSYIHGPDKEILDVEQEIEIWFISSCPFFDDTLYSCRKNPWWVKGKNVGDINT
jgi:hypothetical protein